MRLRPLRPLLVAVGIAVGTAFLSQIAWQADPHLQKTRISYSADGSVAGPVDVPAAFALAAAPASDAEGTASTVSSAASFKVAEAPRKVGPAWLHLDVRRGDTLSAVLSRANISRDEAQDCMSAMKAVFDPRDLQPGQKISVQMDPAGGLRGVEFSPDAITRISVAREAAEAFRATKKELPVTVQRFAADVEIQSSLSEALERANVPSAILSEILRGFSYDVDFQRDLQPGDRIAVLYETAVTPEGQSVGRSALVYASLTLDGRELPIYRFRLADGQYDFFNLKGQSVRKTLLRTPVDGARITSGFGNRVHPILGYTRMHQGVDFGAPTGTPIFAAGDGVVQFADWKSGYGRAVIIRHRSDLETLYGHASRIAAGIRPGARVKQGQVIAYVGSTGRATGPHLHYEVRVNGRAQNPMRITLPTGTTLKGRELTAFAKARGVIEGEFDRLMKEQGVQTAGL